MNNKLNAIRTFLRVAEAGSFSEAARQLNIKQSAVSQQIAALEAELGVVLLHRTTRVRILTAQGEYYRRKMQPILEAMAVENQLSPVAQQWQGKINVQLPGGLGRLFLPHLLGLQKANLGLHLTLSLDDRISDLGREGVDVAFRLTQDAPVVYPARKIARIETPLFASPDFPPLNSLDALICQPHVRFSSIAESAPLRLARGDETLELAVKTAQGQ
ncbi:HTH-type transcriptional regulator DmlR [Pantoea ananatis]|nr:HTH-type transcriptional regulator DmlR [Pantoea ananatis]MCW0339459.1 HTH-type transcriptional regulator DmlR [Pantoea ananatis]MCW0357653.1 HTH-type transcriptional regulator DmlR [Pantoea ananatis]MCW0362327.1 HTH-type transcriptional regulator DmlR [Pantoea ananatis]